MLLAGPHLEILFVESPAIIFGMALGWMLSIGFWRYDQHALSISAAAAVLLRAAELCHGHGNRAHFQIHTSACIALEQVKTAS